MFSFLSLQQLSKTAAVTMLLLLPFAAVFGRNLEKKYAHYIPLIPFAAVFLLSGALLLGVLRVYQETSGKQLHVRPLRFAVVVLVSLISALAMVAIAERLIVAPIERIHFVKYGFLCVFFFFAQEANAISRQLCLAVLGTALAGATEESLQFFIPDRVFDWRDMLLNCVAAIMGGVAILCLIELRNCIEIKPKHL